MKIRIGWKLLWKYNLDLRAEPTGRPPPGVKFGKEERAGKL
jgi:hypothetical protein